MGTNSFFQAGDRYENRLGWYTVVQLGPSAITIRYDDGTGATINDLAQQERIVRRLSTERAVVTKPKPNPTPKPKLQPIRPPKGWRRDPVDSAAFYFGLGFLACRAHIEAHVPQKNQLEFEGDYAAYTGRTLVPGQDMYYIFPDPDIQKWGPDMRVAWRGTAAERDRLQFGPTVDIKHDGGTGQYRINKSAFIRDLFSRGFRLGAYQDLAGIAATVPAPYQDAFNVGMGMGRDRDQSAT